MKNRTVLLFPLLIASCATKQPQVVHMAPRPVPGTTLPSQGIESVRYAETIKAYPMGRYVDPGDSRVMHEGHTIYRVETTPKWNLHPNAQTEVPMGPRVAERDPSRSPSPVNDELRAEINRQKAISREMSAQGERLDKYLQSLHGSLEESKAVAEQNLVLKKQLAETQNRIAQLEAKLKDQGKPAAATAQVQAQKDETKSW